MIDFQTFLIRYMQTPGRPKLATDQIMFYVEFEDRPKGLFTSRIRIHRVESLKIVRYSYVEDDPTIRKNIREWPVKLGKKILNIKPPTLDRAMIIQIGSRDETDSNG